MNPIQSLRFEIINWELLVKLKCNDLFVRTYFFFVHENISKKIS